MVGLLRGIQSREMRDPNLSNSGIPDPKCEIEDLILRCPHKTREVVK